MIQLSGEPLTAPFSEVTAERALVRYGRGSSGHGTRMHRRLAGHTGIRPVDDVLAARQLFPLNAAFFRGINAELNAIAGDVGNLDGDPVTNDDRFARLPCEHEHETSSLTELTAIPGMLSPSWHHGAVQFAIREE